MAEPSFVHAPLEDDDECIRLIKLLRTAKSRYLQCKVEHFRLPTRRLENAGPASRSSSLPEAPSYTALSYTWGDSSEQQTIQLNGRPLTVGVSLFEFLQSMHESSEFDTWFWIDQLSIDQKNVSEKNHQVARMSEIYTRADQVYAWLGLPVTDPLKVCAAFDFLQSVSHTYRLPRNQAIIDVWRSLKELFSRRYWKRLWVVQEVLLASRLILICGPARFELPRALSGEIPLWTRMRWPGDTVEHVGEHREVSQGFMLIANYEQRMSCDQEIDLFKLEEALRTFISCECSDPREKIFGLQACVEERYRIEVDYNLSMEELILRVARLLYQEACGPISDFVTFINTLRTNCGLQEETEQIMREQLGISPKWTKIQEDTIYRLMKKKRESRLTSSTELPAE